MASERRLRNERTVPLNVPIPYPLRDRLDELKQLLDAADLPNVPIREIVAALVFFAAEDGADLRSLIERYRNASPDHAAIGGRSGDGKIVPFRQRARGRPRSTPEA